ncbi:MAG: hypothetical protein JWP14_1571 [Frankiales bacterium]|nr:hypothetical protein [Frankiales bacterium]
MTTPGALDALVDFGVPEVFVDLLRGLALDQPPVATRSGGRGAFCLVTGAPGCEAALYVDGSRLLVALDPEDAAGVAEQTGLTLLRRSSTTWRLRVRPQDLADGNVWGLVAKATVRSLARSLGRPAAVRTRPASTSSKGDAVYVLLTSPEWLQHSAMAVVADDAWTAYVGEDGEDWDGLDHARTRQIAALLDHRPTTANEWLTVALVNLGLWHVGPLRYAASFDDAYDAAMSELRAIPSPAAAPTRNEMMWQQARLMEQWAEDYPEAAAGDVDDPDADLGLHQILLPPVDPTAEHPWTPLAVGDVACGFCDQPAKHSLHGHVSVSAATPSARHRVADVWDDVVGRWLDGDTSLPEDLQRWRDSYRGQVDDRWYPDPICGDLRGEIAEPRLIVLGINPGVGHAELQSREGIWADRIRAQGYSRCLDRVAFDDPAWLRLHGRNSPYWANLMRFANRWTGESLTPPQILNMELYPWHSDRVEGRLDPPADILDRYVWQPVAEIDVPHVFAFGARWLDICGDLGWPLEQRFGPQHQPVPGADAPWWNLAVFGMPSGQKSVVSWQGGYAGPPGATRIAALCALLGAGTLAS